MLPIWECWFWTFDWKLEFHTFINARYSDTSRDENYGNKRRYAELIDLLKIIYGNVKMN